YGEEAISADTPRAAQAIGMRPAQVLLTVELALALPVIVGCIRAATLHLGATNTLAAYTADTHLGRYSFYRMRTRDYAEMLGGAALVILVAVILEVILASCQHFARRVAQPSPLT